MYCLLFLAYNNGMIKGLIVGIILGANLGVVLFALFRVNKGN